MGVGLATPLEERDAVVPMVAERARTVRYDHREPWRWCPQCTP
jgi:hypothetical protein